MESTLQNLIIRLNLKILKFNTNVNLELKSVKLLLNLTNLSLNVQTLEPEIFFKNSRLKLEHIKTNISLKSFINKDFSIDDLQISTKEINLNDLVQLTDLLRIQQNYSIK